MIGPLPESQGYDAILNIVDWFSKQCIAIPITTSLNSEGWAKLFIQHVYAQHGLLRKVISDRGPHFVSAFITELCKVLGVKGSPSTAYHPQTDGQTERVNQELEQYLRIFVNNKQDNWPEWLPLATFSYNDKVNSSTGHSPFFVNKGKHPWKATEPYATTGNTNVDDFVEQLQDIQKEAASALILAQETMKRFYDRSKGESRDYQLGDQVWLEGINIRTDRPIKKLDDKRYGPFEVIAKYGSSYKLKLPLRWQKVIHLVFNEVLLSPFIPPSASQAAPRKPPDLKGSSKVFEVKTILDSRLHEGKLQYLVKWKNYDEEDNTWEPAEGLKGAPRAVSQFHKDHPSAPRPLTTTARKRVRFVTTQSPYFTRPEEPSKLLFAWWDGVYERPKLVVVRDADVEIEGEHSQGQKARSATPFQSSYQERENMRYEWLSRS